MDRYRSDVLTKIAKIQASRFHFQGPRHKLLHMGILAQILENLTNFYFGSDFANCTNFMWSKTSLEEGPISPKLQKFKHHDFIFKVSTPPAYTVRPLFKTLHNTVKHMNLPTVVLKNYTTCVQFCTTCVQFYTSCVFFFYTTVRFICFTVLFKLFKQWSNSDMNSYTWVTMWSKKSLEEGPISQTLRENAHSIFHRP